MSQVKTSPLLDTNGPIWSAIRDIEGSLIALQQAVAKEGDRVKADRQGPAMVMSPKVSAGVEPAGTHLWKIRINDGYCEWEYELPATNGKACIHDIYTLAKKKLKALERDGKPVPDAEQML
jgi:hypothetical protein